MFYSKDLIEEATSIGKLINSARRANEKQYIDVPIENDKIFSNLIELGYKVLPLDTDLYRISW